MAIADHAISKEDVLSYNKTAVSGAQEKDYTDDITSVISCVEQSRIG